MEACVTYVEKQFINCNQINLAPIKYTLHRLVQELCKPSGDLCSSTSDIISQSTEVKLPCVEPLQLQFSSRQVYYIVEDVDDEKLNVSYWLSLPTFEDQEIKFIEERRINLMELAEKYISTDFDLKKSLGDVYRYSDPNRKNEVRKDEKKDIQPNRGNIHGNIINNNRHKDTTNKMQTKKFTIPSRTRGVYSRPGAIHSSKANDPFRSRPPNTSRPPSMHVDDFLALEQGTVVSGAFIDQIKRPGKRPNPNAKSFNTNTSHSESPYHYLDYQPGNRNPNPRNSGNVLGAGVSSSSRGGYNSSRYVGGGNAAHDSYSPPNKRANNNRSGSTGPSSNTQHWTKPMPTNYRMKHNTNFEWTPMSP